LTSSDIGTVLKVIVLGNGNALTSEEITLEEMQVFKVCELKSVGRFLFEYFKMYFIPMMSKLNFF